MIFTHCVHDFYLRRTFVCNFRNQPCKTMRKFRFLTPSPPTFHSSPPKKISAWGGRVQTLYYFSGLFNIAIWSKIVPVPPWGWMYIESIFCDKNGSPRWCWELMPNLINLLHARQRRPCAHKPRNDVLPSSTIHYCSNGVCHHRRRNDWSILDECSHCGCTSYMRYFWISTAQYLDSVCAVQHTRNNHATRNREKIGCCRPTREHTQDRQKHMTQTTWNEDCNPS